MIGSRAFTSPCTLPQAGACGDTSGPVSDNRMELDMTGTTMRTLDASGADLSLHGALVETAPGGDTGIAVGDGNELRSGSAVPAAVVLVPTSSRT